MLATGVVVAAVTATDTATYSANLHWDLVRAYRGAAVLYRRLSRHNDDDDDICRRRAGAQSSFLGQPLTPT